MRCNEIAPYLEDLLDEELEAASPVHEHLAACPECRRRLEWLSASREAFRTLPPERPRNGFDRRLAERIAVETGAKVLPPRGEAWRRPGLQWALAASLLIAVLGGSLFFKGPLSRPPLPQPAAGERGATREAAPAPAPRSAPGTALSPAAPARPERSVEPRPVREEARPVELRASRRTATRPARRAVPVPPPAPEAFEEDRMAGLDAPPTLGYVQAQDLPVSFRCQLDSTQEGCGPRRAGQAECGGFGECSGAGHDAAELAADLSDAVTTD